MNELMKNHIDRLVSETLEAGGQMDWRWMA